jgi:hypothetical protein
MQSWLTWNTSLLSNLSFRKIMVEVYTEDPAVVFIQRIIFESVPRKINSAW